MLQEGQPAPDFTALTTHGTPFRLSDLRGKPVVLYFFPQAFTPGCSLETRQFQGAYGELAALGAVLVGISPDDHDTQCEFAAAMKAGFPLVGDADGHITELYGVFGLFHRARRVTFLIDGAGIVRGVYHHELRMAGHVEDVRAGLQRLLREEAERTESAASR